MQRATPFYGFRLRAGFFACSGSGSGAGESAAFAAATGPSSASTAIAGSLGRRQSRIDGVAQLLHRGAAGRIFARKIQQRGHEQPPEQFLIEFADQVEVALRFVDAAEPADIGIEPESRRERDFSSRGGDGSGAVSGLACEGFISRVSESRPGHSPSRYRTQARLRAARRRRRR